MAVISRGLLTSCLSARFFASEVSIEEEDIIKHLLNICFCARLMRIFVVYIV